MKRFLITVLAVVVALSTLDYARSDHATGLIVLAGIAAAFFLLRHVIG